MDSNHLTGSTKTGTLGGTLLALLFQLNWPGLFQTIIVAAVGAATSFAMSVLLKYLGRKFLKGRDEEGGEIRDAG